MFKFEDALATADALVVDLPQRLILTSKKGEMLATAEFFNDLFMLQAAVEQLVRERKEEQK